MKRFLFITLAALFLTGPNPVSVFSQETETAQTETTLSKKEQKKLKKQQEKEEKARQKEEAKLQQQIEEPQADNSESFQTQPQVEEKVEIQPVQNQKTEISSSGQPNSDNERVISSNGNQENSVAKSNEQSKKSFPTWGWFAIIGTAILGFVIFRYKKYLSQKFAYNIFSVSTIVCLLLSFGTILFLQHLLAQSETGEMWGISKGMFNFLLITALILTIGILYYYNFRKTNWYLAIINVVIQTVAVGVFVIIAIGWIILKFLGSKSSENSTTTQGSTSTSSGKSTIKQKWVSNPREWEYDGRILKQKWVGNSQEWEYDGRILKQKWVGNAQEWEYDGKILKQKWVSNSQEWEYDGKILKQKWVSNPQEWEYDGRILKQKWVSNPREWEINGNVPIPVLAKAAGII